MATIEQTPPNPKIGAVLDINGNFLSFSEEYERIAEIDKNVVGKNHWDIFTGEPENKDVFAEVVRTGVPALIQSKGFELDGLSNKCDDVGHWILYPKFDQKNQVSAVILSYVAVNEEKFRQSLRMDTDHLTNIKNRKGVERFMNQLISKDKNFSLIFIDLNKFKPVNDTYGHDVGDLLLKAIAGRLKTVAREQDMVARLGGDEFVIVLATIKDNTINQVISRINEKFEKPFHLNGIDIKSSASLGISKYPIDGLTIKDLLKSSDEKMYEHKKKTNMER